tara:strand:- start:33 stop:260 length:228 start_codon:yes stop_codon:yes gene_type:complete
LKRLGQKTFRAKLRPDGALEGWVLENLEEFGSLFIGQNLKKVCWGSVRVDGFRKEYGNKMASSNLCHKIPKWVNG